MIFILIYNCSIINIETIIKLIIDERIIIFKKLLFCNSIINRLDDTTKRKIIYNITKNKYSFFVELIKISS